MTSRKFAVASALLAALALPTVAQAGEWSLAYSAHELETPAGLRAVLARAERVAAHACRGTTLAEQVKQKACTAQLLDEMIARIDRPALREARAGGRTRLALAVR